jgi:glutathione synthase/RimK-type ligase-like ATP-grasp enzyme
MTILILGDQSDDHAAFMLEHLRTHGHDVVMVDSRWFPTQLGLAHDPVKDEWTIRLPSGRVLPSGSVRSIYWRCYNQVATPELPDQEQAFVAANDSRSLFESFLIRYPTLWVNGWDGFLLHQTKPAALAMVAKLGVDVPRTISTNDASSVRAFMQEPEASATVGVRRAIFKPVQGGAHTRHVTMQHLTDDNLKNLKYAPVTLQEEIEGTNVRAFVAGQRVLGCEVKAPTIDFRDTDDPQIVPHEFSPEMEDRCRIIARTLHLRWTGIDFRLTPGGRYVFLEANPSPMFLGFEGRSGVPLTQALTDLLTTSQT